MRSVACSSVALCATLFAVPLSAQTLDCVQPPLDGTACVLQAAKPNVNEYLTVRLRDNNGPVGEVKVTFTPMSPTLKPRRVTTGANGDATTLWSGSIDATVTIVASAKVGNAVVERLIIIKPPVLSKYSLTPLHFPDLNPDTTLDYWYVERQFGHAYAVIVNGATEEQCPSVLVLFRQTSSGAMTPDSVYAKWMAKDAYAEPTWFERKLGQSKKDATPACIALTRWKLGKEVGEHHLRAGLPGQPSKAVVFRGRARALPRIIAGLAYTHESEFKKTKSLDSTFRVTRTTPTGEVAYDSVRKVKVRDAQDEQNAFTPLIGLDGPIFTSIPWLRVSASASAKNATTDFFGGLSLLQVMHGLTHEGVGVDVHFVLHWSRRQIVTNWDTCNTRPATCVSESKLSKTPVGWGFMLAVDTGLLSVIKEAFAPK